MSWIIVIIWRNFESYNWSWKTSTYLKVQTSFILVERKRIIIGKNLKMLTKLNIERTKIPSKYLLKFENWGEYNASYLFLVLTFALIEKIEKKLYVKTCIQTGCPGFMLTYIEKIQTIVGKFSNLQSRISLVYVVVFIPGNII